ncbi:homoserine O-succinyltransferase [Enterococcus pallens]|uniref:Homoserine O-acetyltransferase n=1 Tax=Enterococcus pallens ATCC BAA-351 TaxID=1158607 RepID=R2SEJ7_9ENTE|nr:homoserine O-succinyltransferase [Enterococcus pallens]EOH86569.1 homoserine O-succinyltransferase [Enterococcus pallens ATCC BAA-351]EOU18365.1 homoserine O-succinyltransferase [Enterococcus pallens ATCC BAA-351]OJG81323.1 homoserine O-succinyltransferase [Enterococcus pallens]
MPIRLEPDFPAKKVLENEDIFAIDNLRANQQDIRPLKLLILNLMPNKIVTEIQLLRLISQSPLQIDVDFMKVASHEHRNTSKTHLEKYYLEFSSIKETCYDGLIITGAPIEKLPFEEVDYWEELTAIMAWSQTHVTSVIHICWGAQAGLYHHYGINKVMFEEKLFGIFSQKLLTKHRLFRGFDDVFWMPQSRYTGIDEAQVSNSPLEVIARGEEEDATILLSDDGHNVFLLGHFEYDSGTLEGEYLRDLDKGLDTQKPENYYLSSDEKVTNRWRAHAYLFFHNWINDVYQTTPYVLNQIVEIQTKKLNKSF